MAGDIQHVIDTPGDPPVTIGIAARAIAGEIVARVGLEIGIDETLMVAVHSAHLAGQERVITRLPEAGPSIAFPSGS